MPEPVLEARQIIKSFGRVRALRGANFAVYPQEVVALVGDNGAGKSTLVKTMVGVHPPDDGEILFEGSRHDHTPHAAATGIETVTRTRARAGRSVCYMFPGPRDPASGLLVSLGPGHSAMRRAATGFATRLQDPGQARSWQTFLGSAVHATAARDLVEQDRVMDDPPQRSAVHTATCSSTSRRARAWLSVVLISHTSRVVEVADRIAVLRLGARVASLSPKTCRWRTLSRR